MIVIDLVKCSANDEVECKSDEEIYKYFFSQNLHILYNQIRFDFEKYGQDAMIKESQF